jgi:hypothetical protein
MIAQAVSYLGPATVVPGSDRPGHVCVALPDRERVLARLAMSVPYSPVEGDELLVIRHEPHQLYVIGVLEGAGTTTLRVPRDFRLEALQGEVHILAGKGLRLHSDQSLDLDAPRGTLRFARLNVLVTTLVQRLTDAYTWATGLVQLKGRRLRSIADEGWLVRAGRAHFKTSDNVHIAGKTIHLG